MSQLIRSFDWSNHNLGVISTWPQSLRTALNILLPSRSPMLLFWGPDLSCFSNDACCPSLNQQEKSWNAMGQSGAQLWHEIWPDIQAVLDTVLTTGEAIHIVDPLFPIFPAGNLEDASWLFSYNPVFDESGKPGGVLVACSKTAEKSITLPHAEESHDQLFFAIEAAELSTWDFNLKTHRFTANDRFKEWLGVSPTEDVELSTVLDAVDEADRPQVAQAIWVALQPSSQNQYDVVYTISHVKTGQKRIIRAKGRSYFNREGIAYRFAGTAQDITEQITAREQMEQAEELAKLALEGANTGSFFIDLTDNSIIHSATLGWIFTGREVTGMTREQLMTYIHPDDLAIRERAYKKAAQTGQLSYKVRTIWYDDSIHWLKVHGTYLRNSQGVYTRFAGIAQDITEEVVAQQEQQKLLSLVENSADYMAVSDLAGRLVYLNQAGRALIGLEDSQSINELSIRDLFSPDSDNIVDMLGLSLSTEANGQSAIVYLRQHKTGESIPCYANYVTITDPMTDQSIGQGVTLRDLRPVLTAQNELIQSRSILRQVNQRLEMALEAARLGSYEVDWASDRITCTTQCKTNLGFSADASFTLSELITIIVAEDRPLVEKAIMDAVRERNVYSAEYRVIWPDGSLHWIRASGRNIYDDTGSPLRMVGVTLDITLERTAHEKLEREVDERTKELTAANKALQRTNNELEQFAYIASHDLQEPLRKIQSFISILQETQHNEEQADLYLDKITKSAHRMSELIKAVLNYSRLSKTDELFEPTDLNEILQRVLTDFELLIEQKGAIIHYETLPVITGIPLQLNQLLSNLISNSLKFANAEPRIELSCGMASPEEVDQQPSLNPALSYICLSVHDNGIGFDQQYADRIFTLFQRLGNSKAYSGTGIGLALCKRIVDNHNGAITAHSAPGQGATFTVYLPTTQLSQTE